MFSEQLSVNAVICRGYHWCYQLGLSCAGQPAMSELHMAGTVMHPGGPSEACNRLFTGHNMVSCMFQQLYPRSQEMQVLQDFDDRGGSKCYSQVTQQYALPLPRRMGKFECD
jgi:hypothetical protein